MNQQNDEIQPLLELLPHTMLSDGRALARHEGLSVFVTGALAGQKVLARLHNRKTRFAEAICERILEKSPTERPPACPHHDVCGGCLWQAMPYKEQLGWKSLFVQDAFERLGSHKNPPLLAMEPSPKEWRYRNKMEFAFGGQNGADLHLGLKERQSHRIVNVSDCLLQNERTMEVLGFIREFARQSNIEAWQADRGGFWRFAVIREPQSGGCLVEIIGAPHPKAPNSMRVLGEKLLERFAFISGFVHSERRQTSSIAYGEEKTSLWRGKEQALSETIGPLTLSLGNGAFFQVNTAAAEKLYAECARMANLQGGESVWDIYAGVGSIGLYLHQELRTRKPDAGLGIRGVEHSPQAVRLATENAASLGVRANYVQGDALRQCARFSTEAPTPKLVVLDPPRSGLHPELVKGLCAVKAPALLYVSCNPATLARDAQLLGQNYRLQAVRPVDMFPHSPHVECVALFTQG